MVPTHSLVHSLARLKGHEISFNLSLICHIGLTLSPLSHTTPTSCSPLSPLFPSSSSTPHASTLYLSLFFTKYPHLHEHFEGSRNSGWVPQTEMSKAAPGLFNKNNTLKAETCVHDLFNLKHKNREGFRARKPLPWIVHRQLCHSMAGCEVGAEGNLNALLAENNRDNHAAYQRLHDDYANFVKSKHKSAGKERSKSTVRASNPATESPHPDTELIKTAAGRSEKCKLTVNDEEVARQRQAPIARLNEAFAKMPDLKLLMANQKTKHWTSLRVLLASQLLLRTRSCKTRLLVSDESLTGSKRWWSITTAKLSILPRRLAAPFVALQANMIATG